MIHDNWHVNNSYKTFYNQPRWCNASVREKVQKHLSNPLNIFYVWWTPVSYGNRVEVNIHSPVH